MLAAFLVPGLDAQIHGFLAILPTIAEVWMLGYLLARWVNVPLVISSGNVSCGWIGQQPEQERR